MFKNFSSKCFLKLLSFVMFLSLSSRRFHRRVATLSWNIRRLALDRLRDKMIERKQVLGKNIISIRRDKISNFARANFAPCKGIQGSLGFWLPYHGFRIPGIEFRILCQWSLNSGFQSLVGFQIPWAVFWIPKPRILDFTSKTLPDLRIRISLHGTTNYSSFITFSADGLLQKLYLIQHSGPSVVEQLSWCPKVFRATYLCNLVDSLTLAGRSQLFLGMRRRYGSRCGAERSAGCTKYMEPGQLERKNQTDRGLEETTKKTFK